jgi:threonylcarbamoyladenosine tRNA methylthiotransferase MtaB
MQDVAGEVLALAEKGYREVVLTGIHLSSYGVDTGESLLGLISQVHEIPGIDRIRLGSLEPKIVTEAFAKSLSRLHKICPHFHLSLQSGCDATLARMNRKYTCEEYRRGCEILRKYFEHPAITTDVIVGFPGETEEEFAQTRQFLKEISFFETHIFKYSVRKGTRAAVMKNQVPEQVKHQRSEVLAEDVAPGSEAFVAWYMDRTFHVLMEETIEMDGKTYAVGHSPEYVKVLVETGENLSNQLVEVEGIRVLPGHILLGRLVHTENID